MSITAAVPEPDERNASETVADAFAPGDEQGIRRVADELGCDRRLVAAWWSEFVRQQLHELHQRDSEPDTDPVLAQPIPLRLPPIKAASPTETAPPPRTSLRDQTAALLLAKQAASQGPGPEATARQHAQGKLTVRERLDLLLDPGTFVELDLFARHAASGFGLEDKRPATDGVVTGWG